MRRARSTLSPRNARYEEELRERDTRARNIREAQEALKEAASLIRFLKTKEALDDDGSPELVFGDLGEQVERAVRGYIGARLQRPTPKNRPGDSWLAKFVFLLAIELMSGPFPERSSRRRIRPRHWVRQSERGTIRAIEHVLKLAGHGEVVTEHKIRHAIRSIRPMIHKRRHENDGILSPHPRLHPEITQEVAPNEGQSGPKSLA